MVPRWESSRTALTYDHSPNGWFYNCISDKFTAAYHQHIPTAALTLAPQQEGAKAKRSRERGNRPAGCKESWGCIEGVQYHPKSGLYLLRAHLLINWAAFSTSLGLPRLYLKHLIASRCERGCVWSEMNCYSTEMDVWVTKGF